ncbi:MAG: hypothetical protein SOY06_11070 [Prevotella sp.]|nr:hypothetical protein [Bacteroidales bacterium]MDY4230367.1 hypothetical protein [Prevotella sp.]
MEKKVLFSLENLTSIDLYQSKGPLYLYIYSPSHGPTILPSRSQPPKLARSKTNARRQKEEPKSWKKHARRGFWDIRYAFFDKKVKKKQDTPTFFHIFVVLMKGGQNELPCKDSRLFAKGAPVQLSGRAD